MFNIRFLIVLTIFLFVSITPISAYNISEMQNIATNNLKELEKLKNPEKLGFYEQIKLLYTLPKLTYQLNELAATESNPQKEKSLEPDQKTYLILSYQH